ncbi:MAG: heavy-metal-associated domain-containing protein [Candidatus Omnitrophota bacterium]|nr:heavy-metal-associated domain-containing protein [Candidatus Omnitrophota bacterium]
MSVLTPALGSAESTGEALTLEIPGLTCANCEIKVEDAVTAVTGVRSVKASAPTKVVVIFYDPAQAGPEEFIRTIYRVGYIAYVSPPAYRCAPCGVVYPAPGECILCQAELTAS